MVLSLICEIKRDFFFFFGQQRVDDVPQYLPMGGPYGALGGMPIGGGGGMLGGGGAR